MTNNERISIGDYLSLNKRRSDHGIYSSMVVNKIKEAEEWGVPYYSFLKSINDAESRLLFKYYGSKIENDNFYNNLFKDKIFAYDSSTLLEIDSRFNSEVEEEDYLLRFIEKIKHDHFDTSTDRFLYKTFRVIHNILGFEGRAPFAKEKLHFKIGLLSLLLYLFFEAIGFFFDIQSEFLFFHRLLIIMGLLGATLRAIFIFIKKTINKEATVAVKILTTITLIFSLPFFLIILSPIVIFSYLALLLWSEVGQK